MEKELIMEPGTAEEIYWNIIQASNGVLLFFIIVFVLGFFLVRKKSKTRMPLTIYSGSFMVFLILIYADSFSGVTEFITLCREEAGFYGKEIPRGSGVLVPTNLINGCNVYCSSILQKTGDIPFIEGEAKRFNNFQKDIVLPGLYRVTIEDGTSEVCKGELVYQKKGLFGKEEHLPQQYCFHFVSISNFTAEFIVEEENFANLRKSKNIFGSIIKTVHRKDQTILGQSGGAIYTLGVIHLFDLPNLFNNPPTIAQCYDPYQGAAIWHSPTEG